MPVKKLIIKSKKGKDNIKLTPLKKPVIKKAIKLKPISDKINLTPKQRKFCQEYVIEWNATHSYLNAYPACKRPEIAKSAASRLLTNVNVQKYIGEIQKDLEQLCGISKAKIINEHKKLAFSSIAHLHNTWIKRKEFEELTEDQKACISEISTKTEGVFDEKTDKVKQVQFVKIKLYDKQKALDSITKLYGYEAPSKTEVTGRGGKDLISSIQIEIINSATQVKPDDANS